MLTILPTQDQELITQYGPATGDGVALVSKNNDRLVGHIVLEPKGSVLDIIGFSLEGCDGYDALTPDRKTDTDCLLRAAGSYALNRNVYYLECGKSQYFGAFLPFGFTRQEDKIVIHLKELFKVCKH